MQGTVKTFNYERGFGFLRTPEGEEYFVHITSLSMADQQAGGLERGQRVEFDLKDGRKGKEATHVAVLS